MVDSKASMHMLSKRDLSSEELETPRRSRTATTVLTANGEVQTNEETQVYVHDLELFVMVQMFDDTLAVLSLGKLCEEHGSTFEWASEERGFSARRKISYPLLSWDCRQILVPARLFLSLPQDSSSTSSSPATERSDDQAPGNWRD